MRALVVEDDRKLAGLIARGLREAGMVIDVVGRGDEAVDLGAAGRHDVIVLDVMLPGLDGFAVCRALRDRGVTTPVVMLTARDAIEDRIRGLDGGADDYVAKPFVLAELAARIRALARRGALAHGAELVAGDLRLDPASRRAWRDDEEVALSSQEFGLLEALLRHAGLVLDRNQLRDQAWTHPDGVASNVVDVYIGYLREKVDRPFGVRSIETVRGIGYRLRTDGGRAHPTSS